MITRSSKSSESPELPTVEYEDIISGEGRLNKNIFEKTSNKKGIYFSEGDVLFGKLRPYLQNWLLADFTGIAVGDWWVLSPSELASTFLYTYIQMDSYQNIANLSSGTKMPRSDCKTVSNSVLSFPPSPNKLPSAPSSKSWTSSLPFNSVSIRITKKT